MDQTLLTGQLPEMLPANLVKERMLCLPEIHPDMRNEGQKERFSMLDDIYKIYVPSIMSVEIYNKIYLSMYRSIRKKESKAAVQQSNQNYQTISGGFVNQGVIGGGDTFSIIGNSGIGKTSAIAAAVELAAKGNILLSETPKMMVIPCLSVQCPYDCSAKSLLLSILQRVDGILGTDYYGRTVKYSVTTERLLAAVSQICLNHIGLLIIDEIQNVVGHRSGITLIALLTQLINQSGIAICMVGVPSVMPFFRAEMHLARRTVGLFYEEMPFDREFEHFVKCLCDYQYVHHPAAYSDALAAWLYEKSGGIISVVVQLWHDAQEGQIGGGEKMGIPALEEAFRHRHAVIAGYVDDHIIKPGKKSEKIWRIAGNSRKRNEKNSVVLGKKIEQHTSNIEEILFLSKKEGTDPVAVLSQIIPVIEVRL